MITENLSTLKIHKLTQSQYDKELEAGRIDNNALYLTPDETADLTGLATEDYVKEYAQPKGNYLTTVPSEYITETELSNKGYAKQTDVDKLQDAKVVVSNDEPNEGILWIDKDADEEVILAEIDDNDVSDEKTWSSSKIEQMFTEYVDEIAELVGGDA